MSAKKFVVPAELSVEEFVKGALWGRVPLENFTVLEDADGQCWLLLVSSGGRNSMGGAKSVWHFPDDLQRVDIPLPWNDSAYHFWATAHLLPLPLKAPVTLKLVEERWGDWSPNYYNVSLFSVAANGQAEKLRLLDD